MIDTQTVLMFGVALTIAEFVLMVAVWLGHRKMLGVFRVTACFGLIPFGHIFITIFRTPVGIVLGNCAVHSAIALYAVGLAQLLDRPKSHKWIVQATFLLTFVIWGAAMTFDPDNTVLRITVVMILTVTINSWMCVVLYQDRILQSYFRYATIVIIIGHNLDQIARVIDGWRHGNAYLQSHPFPWWTVFMALLYSNCMFLVAAAIIYRKSHLQPSPTADVQIAAIDPAPQRDGITMDWSLSSTSWELFPPGKDGIRLTAAEYGLVSLLAEGTPGTALSRDEIFDRLPRKMLNNPNNLDALVRRVRKKVKDACDIDLPIKTVYGVGYTTTQRIKIS